MEKIIRFFPLNKGIGKGDIKSLIKTVGIYMVTNIVLFIAVAFLEYIPLVKNLLHHVDNVYEVYIWVGSLLGVFQYVTGVDASQIEFVKLEDVLALWNNQKYKKYILIGAAVLCLVPYGGVKSVNNMPPQASNDVAQSGNVSQGESADIDNLQNAQTDNSDRLELESETIRIPEVEKFVPGNYIGEVEKYGLTYALYDNGAEVISGSGVDGVCVIQENIEYYGNVYEVKSIDDMMFSYDSSVYTIIMSDTITTVGTASIKECKFLTSIYLSKNLAYLGDEAISGNSSLETIIVPDTLKKTGKGALCWNYGTPKVKSTEQAEILMAQNHADMSLEVVPDIENVKPEVTVKDYDAWESMRITIDGVEIVFGETLITDLLQMLNESADTGEVWEVSEPESKWNDGTPNLKDGIYVYTKFNEDAESDWIVIYPDNEDKYVKGIKIVPYSGYIYKYKIPFEIPGGFTNDSCDGDNAVTDIYGWPDYRKEGVVHIWETYFSGDCTKFMTLERDNRYGDVERIIIFDGIGSYRYEGTPEKYEESVGKLHKFYSKKRELDEMYLMYLYKKMPVLTEEGLKGTEEWWYKFDEKEE